MNRSVLL